MKKIVTFLLLVTTYNICLAQEEEVWEKPSKESEAYHEYREKITRPPYGLAKILALIAKIDTDSDDQNLLPKKDYLILSLREKFTYHMVHAESYSQNCDVMPPIPDEDKKIFAHIPDAFGDSNWSEQQREFLSYNRDSVMALMTASIGRTNRIGVNYKTAILEINAKEMIPLLISTYNKDHKDHDILTVLMLLMKMNKYEPFLSSVSYKKLFADENNNYQSFLNFNTANEALIIQRANNFYNALPKKG